MSGTRILGLGAGLAALGVIVGAFGAHGLADTLQANGPRAAAAWDTGAQYHMYAAFGVIACGLAAPRFACKGAVIAAWLLTGGLTLFSGSLYAWSVTAYKPLVFVTPVGGLLLILGFGALACTACSSCAMRSCQRNQLTLGPLLNQ